MTRFTLDSDHNLIDNNTGEVEVDDAGLRRVAERVQRVIELENEIDEREAELKMMKAELRELQITTLPPLMMAAGASKFRTADGRYDVEKKLLIEGSLPKDPHRRATAVTQIEHYGGGDLIKPKVEIPFAREQLKDAMKLITQLRQRGLNPAFFQDIHPMTLKAWVREGLANGRALPSLEDIGLWAGDFVEVKERKR